MPDSDPGWLGLFVAAAGFVLVTKADYIAIHWWLGPQEWIAVTSKIGGGVFIFFGLAATLSWLAALAH